MFQFPAQAVCDYCVDVIWDSVTNQALISQEHAVMNGVLVTLKP